jgi:YfiH family protein
MAEPALDRARSTMLGQVPHGFFGRGGGVSTGLVAGLQCGFGADDDDAAVRQNRRMAADAILVGAPLVAPHQVHSPDVIAVTEPWSDDNRPAGDAVVTNRTGLVLGVVTADCAPVIFADAEAGVIGAAHAGWRGAHGGVLENTLAAMEALGADRARIAAAIGPTIAQASYEVDDGFRARFRQGDSDLFASGRAGHWQFDLPAYAMRRLRAAGLSRVENLTLDTYALEVRYYSFRRATHRGEPNYGRQISLVALA